MWAVVTGANSPIGQAIATELFEAGYHLVLTYHRSSDAIKRMQTAREGEPSQKILSVQLDISDSQAIQSFGGFLDEAGIQPSVLVNNAGQTMSPCSFWEVAPEVVDTIVDVNLKGTFWVTQVVTARMPHHQGASVIFISSEAGTFGGMGITPYAMAKAGVSLLVKSLARECGPRGIRVNALSPGLMDSGLNAEQSDDWKRTKAESIPLGRLGQPLDVARWVVRLAEPSDDYLSGAVIPLSGAR